jgi:hypothetical protein
LGFVPSERRLQSARHDCDRLSPHADLLRGAPGQHDFDVHATGPPEHLPLLPNQGNEATTRLDQPPAPQIHRSRPMDRACSWVFRHAIVRRNEATVYLGLQAEYRYGAVQVLKFGVSETAEDLV